MSIKDVKWSVENLSGKASISTNGLLTGITPGTVKVIAEATDGSIRDDAILKGEAIVNIAALYEAEDAVFTGIKNNNHAGFSGTGFLQTDATIEFGISEISTGYYDFIIRYATPRETGATYSLYVGDKKIKQLFFQKTGKDWTYWSTLTESVPVGSPPVDTITIKMDDGDDGEANIGYLAVCPSGPLEPVQSITLTSANDVDSVNTGKTLQMYADILPDNASIKDVVWSVANLDGNPTGSAHIDQNGLLTGKASGTVRVKAQATDGTMIFGEKIISVIPHSYSVAVSASALTPVAGENNAITFTVKDSSGALDTSFNGDVTVSISGISASPCGSSGIVNGTAIVNGTFTETINFTNGEAAIDLVLHNAAAQTINFSVEGLVNKQAALTITPKNAGTAFLAIAQDIAPPAVSGGLFTVQPKLVLKDVYGNICTTDNSTTVTAAKEDGGQWVLAGSMRITADAGEIAFSSLSAINTSDVSDARLRFTSPGLATVKSTAVSLPASTKAQGFAVIMPESIAAGAPFQATIEARNVNGSTDVGFTGEAVISCSDAEAVLPQSIVFESEDMGRKTITAALNTLGSHTITVSEAPDPSLLGYWRFDEGNGTSVRDSSTGNRTGSFEYIEWYSGAPGTRYANPGGLWFPGYGYVEIGSAPNIANKSFSIGFWAKRDFSTGKEEWLILHGNTATDQGLHIGFRENNEFSFAFYSDDLNIPSGSYINDTNWHHWLATYDAVTKTQRVYQDGILRGTRTAYNHFNYTGVMYVGMRERPNELSIYYRGHMDELQIYGRALTPEEAGLLALGSAAIVCGTNEIRSEELYSVSVQWGSMEFVYSDGTWNPETHEYEGGGWTHEPDANKITITSESNIEIGVGFEYKQESSFTDISGSFADENGIIEAKALPRGDSQPQSCIVHLVLSGYPPIMDKQKIGTVVVTIN